MGVDLRSGAKKVKKSFIKTSPLQKKRFKLAWCAGSGPIFPLKNNVE
jgi:hypothetical protein